MLWRHSHTRRVNRQLDSLERGLVRWVAAWRRERRVLRRVSWAAWRLEQAERERAWALASARAEGISIRTLAERKVTVEAV